jgi:C4-dicarboxylate transporter, DctQ subunit
MGAMWRSVIRAYDRFVTGLGLAAGFLFGAMAIGITIDVSFRNLYGSGVGWMIELLEYAMLVATLMAAPWVLREGAHVTVDVVVANVRPTLRRALRLVSNALGLLICLAVLGFGWRSTAQALERGSLVYKAFVFPEWWVLALLPLGMTLLAIEFARLLRRAWLADDRPDSAVAVR